MAITTWPVFFRRCITRRVSEHEFGLLLQLVETSLDSSSPEITKAYFQCRDDFCIEGDPLVLRYAVVLLRSGLVKLSQFLIITTYRWNQAETASRADLALLHTLVGYLISSNFADLQERRLSLLLASRWLLASSRSVTLTPTEATQLELLEPLAMLVIALAGNDVGVLVSPTMPEKKTTTNGILRKTSQEAIEAALPLLSTSSIQLFNQLDVLLKDLREPLATSSNIIETNNLKVLELEATVADSHILPTWTTLVAFLDITLRKQRTVDENALLVFLNGRHGGNNESMFRELVRASLHLYVHWSVQTDAKPCLPVCRSFVVDKVPSILYDILTSSFGAFSTETCLLREVEVDIDSNLRQSFLTVCCRHALLSSSAAQPFGINQVTPFRDRQDFANQLKSDVRTIGQLLDNALALTGDSTAIVQAISECALHFCRSKETAALKELSISIVKKPEVIDLIALHVRPILFLRPMCTLLDAWRWDDLHGESQPVYEEFGCILLLVIAFQQRLDLHISDLGLDSTSQFVLPFLERQLLLDEESIGEWINAMFVAEGLADELTASCSPQIFYRLAPELLHQSMLAYECAKISVEMLKAGLEYLLVSFLLPSLVPCLFWLASQHVHQSSTVTVVLQVLTKTSSDADTKELHRIILDIVAEQMRSASLPTHTMEPFCSSIQLGEQDLRSWRSTRGGIIGQLRQPALLRIPGYNGQLIDLAVKVHGAHVVIQNLLQLTVDDTSLDFISGVVCATPDLRNALQLYYQRLGSTLGKHDNAETVVRLHRRVESLIVLAIPEPTIAQLDVQQTMVQPDPVLDTHTFTQHTMETPNIDAVIDSATNDLNSMQADVFNDTGEELTNYNFDDLDIDGMF